MNGVPTRSLGVFRARASRDGVAREHDGRHYYAMNEVVERTEHPDGALFEVQFADGLWMLARGRDLIAAATDTVASRSKGTT